MEGQWHAVYPASGIHNTTAQKVNAQKMNDMNARTENSSLRVQIFFVSLRRLHPELVNL